MLGIDTNVLVRFLVRDDPEQFERGDSSSAKSAAAKPY